MEVKIHCSYHAIVNISELREHPDNNNKHTEKQIERLSKIIKKNGWTSPITISRLSGYITRGHARFMAAKKLRCRNIPVQYISYESPEHEYADATADNEIARWATLDLDKVRDKVLDFDDNFDLDLLGIENFEMSEIEDENLLSDDGIESEPDFDEENIIVKKNQIWILGNHRVLCGDSTDVENVKKLLNGECPTVYTDPPYGINVVKSSKIRGDKSFRKGSIGNNNLVKSSIYKEIKNDETTDTAKNFYNVCKYELDLTKFIIWGGNYFTDFLDPSKYWGIWDKKERDWNDDFSDFEMLWSNVKAKPRIFRFMFVGMVSKGEKEDRFHPTQKPVEMQIEVLNHYKVNDIFDGFLGSGSSLMACEKTKRKCYGAEYEEYYCEKIINRWQDYTGKDAILESTGQTYKELKDA